MRGMVRRARVRGMPPTIWQSLPDLHRPEGRAPQAATPSSRRALHSKELSGRPRDDRGVGRPIESRILRVFICAR